MQSSRKRTRSDDCAYSFQKKTFVNQHLIDSRSDDKMREIQDRTIQLLLKGARNLYNGKLSALPVYHKNVKLFANGTIQYPEGTQFKDQLAVRIPSRCCKKLALIKNDCSNCSLAVCEFCGYTCVGCGTFLCTACVCLFECGGDERPCCYECQFFNIE